MQVGRLVKLVSTCRGTHGPGMDSVGMNSHETVSNGILKKTSVPMDVHHVKVCGLRLSGINTVAADVISVKNVQATYIGYRKISIVDAEWANEFGSSAAAFLPEIAVR